MNDTAHAPAGPQPRPAETVPFRATTPVAFLVAGTFFMEMLDGTIITTALPDMARSFDVAPVDLNLGVTAYMLTLAIFIPLSGWAAERWGARTTFGAAITIFTLASILCGLSNSLWSFTTARVLQGFGGAMMVPVGRVVVLRELPKSELMRAIAILTWPGLLAPILGPPIGGFITANATWRWIFFLNVPLGALGLALTLVLVPQLRSEHRRALDWVGFVLVSASCLMMVFGLSLIGSDREAIWLPAGLLVLAAILGILAFRHAARHPAPLIDLAAFRIPTFLISNVGGSLQRACLSTAPFLLPLMFQVGFGYDPVTSGLLLLVLFAGNLAIKPATSWVLRRFGFKRVLIGNGFILAGSLAACGLLSPTTPLPLAGVVLFVGGASRSMQFTALNTIAFADVPRSSMTAANVLATLLQQLAMGAGAALGAIALRLAALLLASAQATPTIADFHVAFGLIGALSLAGAADLLALPSGAGKAVSGHG